MMGGGLHLVQHFWIDETASGQSQLRLKSLFNPMNNHVIIRTYHNYPKERLLDTEIPSKLYFKMVILKVMVEL